MLTIGKESANAVSLYFHIPFCKKKCPYCHFFVLPDQERFKVSFLSALALEWKRNLPLLQGKEVVSIYFGGGTPSRLSLTQLQEILDLIQTSPLIFCQPEITLEVNPEDVTVPFAEGIYALGINRVSLGIQSLEEGELITLGRGHGREGALKAIWTLFNAGITNISIDLMYDLPRQTQESFKKTLSLLEGLPITHLSLYNLTIEPHTNFFKHQKSLLPLIPTQEESSLLLEEAISAIEKLGLKRYEISAFAKPSFHSRHNTGYWIGRPFLGFGPSAFSYFNGKRFQNKANLNHYVEALKEGKSPIGFEEKLEGEKAQRELLAVELRLLQGVDLGEREPLSVDLEKTIESLCQKGSLKRNGSLLSLTKEGLLFYDSVASDLV